MKKRTSLIALSLAAASGGFAQQTSKSTATAFQYISVGGPGARVLSVDAANTSTVTGRPFSAVQERHSVQTLGDGTRIVNTDTDKIFRDLQGRVRIDHADGSSSLQDPAEGKMFEWSGKETTVRPSGVRKFYFSKNTADATPLDKAKAEALHSAQSDGNVMFRRSTAAAGALPPPPVQVKSDDTTEEDLGVQFINGVNAHGHRSTIHIASGQIGNDRPIQVVHEIWYSDELQMTVKTTNSDPRFGETTFQLTNIVQGAQDPSLFQAPTPELPNK